MHIHTKNRTLFRLRESRPFYQQNFLGVPRIQAIFPVSTEDCEYTCALRDIFCIGYALRIQYIFIV